MSEIELVEAWKQWMLGPDPVSVPAVPGVRYSLKNKREEFLQYESQDYGINLGFTDHKGDEATGRKVAKFFFTRYGGSDGPLSYGETVALGWDKTYLRYAHRTFGINLDWSDQPVYEWQIHCGTLNGVVQTYEWFALVNVAADPPLGEPLIFFDRTVGGNLGWPSSQTWSDKFKQEAWGIAKKAAIGVLVGLASA